MESPKWVSGKVLRAVAAKMRAKSGHILKSDIGIDENKRISSSEENLLKRMGKEREACGQRITVLRDRGESRKNHYLLWY